MRPALDALPVALSLAGPHAESIRRYLEGVVGWQDVGAAAEGPVPARIRLVDVTGAAHAGDRSDLPTLLLVSREDQPLVAALAAREATRVLGWPSDHADLLRAAEALSTAPRASRGLEIRVGGAAGGVGTTTVALALGGLAAWHGGRTLVLSHGTVPAPTNRSIAVEDLTGAGTWDVADPVPGVRGLRVLRLPHPPGDSPIDRGPAATVIRDAGVDLDVDVLVARRDRAGVEALRRSTAGACAIVDDGPASRRDVATAAGGRQLVALEHSTRVARAGLQRRVPAALPGSWLARLDTVLTGRRR